MLILFIKKLALTVLNL